MPQNLGPEWTWKPGMLLLGRSQGREIGIADPRHQILLAGSRGGKSSAVIIPNLQRYPGPMIVIDPKGELARVTAKDREKFGPVHILAPFRESGLPSSSFNPFDELRQSADLSADAAQLAEALIIDSGGKDSHWTDSAKNLIKGLALYLLTRDPARATVAGFLELLNETPTRLIQVFEEMVAARDEYAAMANTGRAFLAMMKFAPDGTPVGFTNEMGSILSTARQQTSPLNEVARISGASSFNLADMGRRNLTVYLVLPGMRLASHHRWLRLIIMQAMAAMERNPIPKGKLPVWFVLEEFAALGRVRAIEVAAGYMAGAGVKLWAILQDLAQLKTHYPDSWETFLGNAGVIQAFANLDLTTTQTLSNMMGQTQYLHVEQQPTSSGQMQRGDYGARGSIRAAPLLAPFEITASFSRKLRRQLVLTADYPPVFLDMMPPYDAAPRV